MSQTRTNPIPLPAAVLALSVAVCIGAGSPAGAAPTELQRQAQAEQRETIAHLIDAINQAAKRLSDRLTGQSALADREAIRPVLAIGLEGLITDVQACCRPLPLRDALLNLPPPACRLRAV